MYSLVCTGTLHGLFNTVKTDYHSRILYGKNLCLIYSHDPVFGALLKLLNSLFRIG